MEYYQKSFLDYSYAFYSLFFFSSLKSSKVRGCACWRFCLFGVMGDNLAFLVFRSCEARLAKRRLSRWYPRRSRRFGGCVDDGRLEIHDRNACDFVDFVALTCRDTDTSMCG